MLPVPPGVAVQLLSRGQGEATETAVTPTASAFCAAASPQLRDIMDAMAALSDPSAAAGLFVADGSGNWGGVDSVPVGMVKGGIPVSSKVGIGSSGTPFMVCGYTSAEAGAAAHKTASAAAAANRRWEWKGHMEGS